MPNTVMSDPLSFNLLIEFFEEDNWDFQWMTGMSVLTLNYSGTNGHWQCYAQAREAQQQLVFYSVLPANAAPAMRNSVAEFITRANYGMVIGNFEMDYDDGEIRYKTSVDVEGSTVTLPLIRQLVYANISIMDHYFPALMRVLYGGIAPQEALADLMLETQQTLDDLVDDDDVDGGISAEEQAYYDEYANDEDDDEDIRFVELDDGIIEIYDEELDDLDEDEDDLFGHDEDDDLTNGKPLE